MRWTCCCPSHLVFQVCSPKLMGFLHGLREADPLWNSAARSDPDTVTIFR
jgi:hypothetical protein